MALYLDEQTRTWLERAVKKANETDFIAKRVQKMLEADRERLEVIGKCEHNFVSFKGKKHCCGKCGAFGVGMGEEWILEKDVQ